ncbi:MAG TPA: transposase [Terriglobales bacterium]|nr:transposase [Terriglobales bacterium]
MFESRAFSPLQTRQAVVRPPSETKRAYRYRFYPTPQQAGQLARTFGCGRFIDTWGLATRQHASFHQSRSRYSHDLAAMLPALTEDYPFLGEVCSVPLQQALRHLERALVHFLEGRADSPTFNKNRNDQSATAAATAFTWDGHCLTRAKMQAPLALRWPRPLPAGTKPSSLTVSRESAGRSFVSILVREQIKPLALTPRMVGGDLGLTSCVVTSAGQEIATPQPSRRVQKKVAQAQRRHARQKNGSKNREQARRKVARIHARRADRRRDSQHQHSHRITRENPVICVERLVVKTRLEHPHLAKSISDVGWAEFVRQRGDKATWDGRTLIKIDQWFPSSKTCHACQDVLSQLDRCVRAWVCPHCGALHQRDHTAAKKVLSEGLSALEGLRR